MKIHTAYAAVTCHKLITLSSNILSIDCVIVPVAINDKEIM